VYIAPTRNGPGEEADTGGDNYWALDGFDMKAALAKIYSSREALFPETRIVLPASFDPHDRYDFVLVLASHETSEMRNRLMQQGIERHFRVLIVHESRLMGVYVLTAPDGQGAANKDSPQFEGGGTGSTWLKLCASRLRW